MSLLNVFFDYKDEMVKVQFDLSPWRVLEYNDISRIVAHAVTDYRVKYNLTVKDMAKLLGCTKHTLYQIETGQLEDISFKFLIELWTKLSTPDFNFGDLLMDEIHKVVVDNYEYIKHRRWRNNEC